MIKIGRPKKIGKRITITIILNEGHLKIWRAISTNANRNYSDAFKLLLGLVKDSEKGKTILKIGGYENDT